MIYLPYSGHRPAWTKRQQIVLSQKIKKIKKKAILLMIRVTYYGVLHDQIASSLI